MYGSRMLPRKKKKLKRGHGRGVGTDSSRKSKIWGIKRHTLELILEVSKESYPNEFAGVLRAEGGVITELMLLPGTVSGNMSALIHLHMLPIDYSVVGSVHSHPSFSYLPSGADLIFFSRAGHVNIIVARPYTSKSWRAYDPRGNPIELEVVN
jgi:proteasome lid subunit RPN8/RPN11